MPGAAILMLLALLTSCVTGPGPLPDPTNSPTPLPTAIRPDGAGESGEVPLNLPGWMEETDRAQADPEFEAGLLSLSRQMGRLSPTLAGLDLDSLAELLALPEDADPGLRLRQEAAVLGLNLLSGRLNRATMIAYDGLPGVGTVQDLLDLAEAGYREGRVEPGLLEALIELRSGQGIVEAVHGRLVYLQPPHEVRIRTWTDEGMTDEVLWSPGADGFARNTTDLRPSPDYRYAAIETRAMEAGGPVYLLDLETGEMANLNRLVGLSLSLSGDSAAQDEREPWQVVAWHPDSRHLLLTVEGQSAAFWVDIEAMQYTRIALSEHGECLASQRLLALLPDGSGFAYVAEDGRRLEVYSFADDRTTTVLELPEGEGRLGFPRYCPDGTRIAYLVETPGEDDRPQYHLWLYDHQADTLERISPGPVQSAEPVWSPDGQSLAFRCAGADESATAGELWVMSPRTGSASMVTEGASRGGATVWAPSCQLLAFPTEGGVDVQSLASSASHWPAAGLPDGAIAAFFLP